MDMNIYQVPDYQHISIIAEVKGSESDIVDARFRQAQALNYFIM